ncbi:hypothetical protein [Nocardia sp. CA-290969]|uniref:hypothetical protein n=1 Tax=Nocardia sp. CA-290969 TaxID=3239986 RepID=UPI003D93D9FF
MLKQWRATHPAEKTLNLAALLHPWPSSRQGVTRCGPVRAGTAELFDAGAHKAWTATRLAGGVATLGGSAALMGRKNKGVAALSIQFGNGAVESYTVKPDKTALRDANTYVAAFNTLATQLAAEGQPRSE